MVSKNMFKKDKELTNYVEIRAYGLMRSGNHAIIEWIQNQYSGQRTCFLNNVKHGDFDPYRSFYQKKLTKIYSKKHTERLRKLKKCLLIYSYEDREEIEKDRVSFLESVFNSEFEEKRAQYVGKSKYFFNLLIIRDPFNCFASRLKLLQVRGAMRGASDPLFIAENWKQLAQDAIAQMKDPKPNRIVVNYNQWVASVDYRKELSRILKGTFNDSTFDTLSSFGGGSSFHDTLDKAVEPSGWFSAVVGKFLLGGQSYNPSFENCLDEVQRKELFERWRLLASNETFRKMIDEEVLVLSEELFGEIEGTRDFVKTLG